MCAIREREEQGNAKSSSGKYSTRLKVQRRSVRVRNSYSIRISNSNLLVLRYRSMVSVPAQKTRHSESTFGHFHSDLFGTLPPPPIHSRSSSDMTPLFPSLRGTFDRFTALFRLLLQWLEVYFATGTWTRSRRRRRARSTATPTAARWGRTVIL